MKSHHTIVTAALLFGLAACGGGGDVAAPPPATDAVPDSASASATAMKGWLAQVAATAPEDKEALAAARFAPPQPDDVEPESLQ